MVGEQRAEKHRGYCLAVESAEVLKELCGLGILTERARRRVTLPRVYETPNKLRLDAVITTRWRSLSDSIFHVPCILFLQPGDIA